MGAALKKRDRDRLAAALDGLPARVAYLRDAILDVSKQDQDLLGCGEADTRILAKAVRTRVGDASTDAGTEALAAAEELHRWLKQTPDNGAPWAGPVWFVEGFLRGIELYGMGGNEADEVEAVPPPPLGLRRVEIDVPSGMKVKLHAGGIEMSNREAQIFITDLSDDVYRYRHDAYFRSQQPPPAEYGAPHRQERAESVTIGSASGFRATLRHVSRDWPACTTTCSQRRTSWR